MDLGFNLDDLTVSEGVAQPCPFDESTSGKPKWAHCCDGHGNARNDGKWNRCGEHWPNHEALGHCPTCHKTFASTAAFDLHRVGPFNGPRTCHTTDVMTGDGWTTRTEETTVWQQPEKGEDQ